VEQCLASRTTIATPVPRRHQRNRQSDRQQPGRGGAAWHRGRSRAAVSCAWLITRIGWICHRPRATCT